jgi:hypothetical protein
MIWKPQPQLQTHKLEGVGREGGVWAGMQVGWLAGRQTGRQI